jgi:hypothetical protein
METQSSNRNAAHLRTVLLAVLAAAMGWAVFSFYELADDVSEFLKSEGAVAGDPASVDAWSALGAIDGDIWLAMLVWLALISALGKCFLLMLKAPWGKDFSWSDGRWMDTDPLAVVPGAGLPLAAPLRESMGGSKAGLIVMVVISAYALVAAIGAIDLPEDGGALSPLQLVPLFGALALAAFVAYGCAHSFTRRVQFDDAGLCDANFFRSQRIAWSQVKEFKLDDIGSGPSHGPDGSTNLPSQAWVLKDGQGRTMLTLAQDMAPPESLLALRERIRSRIGLGPADGAGGFGFLDVAPVVPAASAADQADRPSGVNQALIAQALLEHHQRFEEIERKGNRGALLSMALALLLFLVPAVITTYQALWFMFSAAQTEGLVVEIPEGSLPSLVVEYRAGAGQPLRINSDGADAYSGYKVGDKVGVFYDPQEPEDARLDFFLELWLGPIVLGILALITGLITALVAWGFRPRRGT